MSFKTRGVTVSEAYLQTKSSLWFRPFSWNSEHLQGEKFHQAHSALLLETSNGVAVCQDLHIHLMRGRFHKVANPLVHGPREKFCIGWSIYPWLQLFLFVIQMYILRERYLPAILHTHRKKHPQKLTTYIEGLTAEVCHLLCLQGLENWYKLFFSLITWSYLIPSRWCWPQ